MQLSKNVRQVIGTAIGAAIAAVVSTTLPLPAVERHEAKFGRGAATEPAGRVGCPAGWRAGCPAGWTVGCPAGAGEGAAGDAEALPMSNSLMRMRRYLAS